MGVLQSLKKHPPYVRTYRAKQRKQVKRFHHSPVLVSVVSLVSVSESVGIEASLTE